MAGATEYAERGSKMPPRVLLIEDDADVQSLYAAVLGVHGYETTWAKDGQEGIDCLHEAKPDLVVLDMCMPRKSGWEVLGVMSASEELRDIPVVVITALGNPANVSRGWALGVTAYLTKPVCIDELVLLASRLAPVHPSGSPALQEVSAHA